jgi:hypothetical protein
MCSCSVKECVGQPLPSNYMELEKMMVAEGKKKMPPIVSWTEYQAMARLCLIDDERDLLTATSILHNLGSLVHFPNEEKVPFLFLFLDCIY